MPELPTGTVTFLFTDLEGSTRLWQEHPEAMKVAAARHDELLHAIERHSGYVVKTTGDGFHAAFGAAHDAVDAAVAGQLALGGRRVGGQRARWWCAWVSTPVRRSSATATTTARR